MVVGLQGRGKTTLLSVLRDPTASLPENISTVGVNVADWVVKAPPEVVRRFKGVVARVSYIEMVVARVSYIEKVVARVSYIEMVVARVSYIEKVVARVSYIEMVVARVSNGRRGTWVYVVSLGVVSCM